MKDLIIVLFVMWFIFADSAKPFQRDLLTVIDKYHTVLDANSPDSVKNASRHLGYVFYSKQFCNNEGADSNEELQLVLSKLAGRGVSLDDLKVKFMTGMMKAELDAIPLEKYQFCKKVFL